MTETAAKSQPDPKDTPEKKELVDPLAAKDLHSIFVWNVVTLLALGTAIYVWADYYTDRLPAIVTLLGGGGALAWLTTAMGFFKSQRKEELINWAETAVFAQRWFSVSMLVAIIVLLVSSTQFAAVQVQSLPDESEHSVSIWQDGKAPPPSPAKLAPGEHIRRLVFTPLFCKRSVHVHITGYPDKVVEVQPMQRVPVYVPNSVRTPVVLIHPTIRLMDAARPEDGTTALFKLEVESKDGPPIHAVDDFDGQHSVLIGGDDEIAIPSEIVDEWRSEADKRLDAFKAWRSLVAPRNLALTLTPEQTITFTLRPAQCPPDTPNGPPPAKCPIYSGPVSYKVKVVHGSQPYIQEVQLDTPPDKK